MADIKLKARNHLCSHHIVAYQDVEVMFYMPKRQQSNFSAKKLL